MMYPQKVQPRLVTSNEARVQSAIPLIHVNCVKSHTVGDSDRARGCANDLLRGTFRGHLEVSLRERRVLALFQKQNALRSNLSRF